MPHPARLATIQLTLQHLKKLIAGFARNFDVKGEMVGTSLLACLLQPIRAFGIK
jgi:hypothetical protein